jgi:hypothetical protein
MLHEQSLRRRLADAILKHAAAAAQIAVSGGDSTEDIVKLEQYQKLQAALRRPSRDWYLAITIAAFICILVALLNWKFHPPTTTVHLSVKASTILMRVTAPFTWQGGWPKGGGHFVHLRDFHKLEMPPEYRQGQSLQGRAWLDVRGGQIQINELTVNRNAELVLTRNDDGDVDIQTRYAPFRGELSAAGKLAISADSVPSHIEPAHVDWRLPVSVGFLDDGRHVIRADLRTSVSKNLTLPPISIDQLSLFSEAPNLDQGRTFVRSIIAGAMTLPDGGTQIDLQPADTIVLRDARGLVTGLTVGPRDIQLTFDGEAREVLRGVPGYEQDLTPTLLQYFYHREPFTLACTTVFGLWALLWGARNLTSR